MSIVHVYMIGLKLQKKWQMSEGGGLSVNSNTLDKGGGGRAGGGGSKRANFC